MNDNEIEDECSGKAATEHIEEINKEDKSYSPQKSEEEKVIKISSASTPKPPSITKPVGQ